MWPRTQKPYELFLHGSYVLFRSNEYPLVPVADWKMPIFSRHAASGGLLEAMQSTSRLWGHGIGYVQYGSYWHFTLPIYLVVAGLLPPWLGLSLWRARRIAAMLK